MIEDRNNLPELPKGWVWTRLGEISILGAGNAAPQGKEYFENGVYPFVRVQDMGNLGNARYVFDTKDRINIKATERMKLFPKGSVLFTKSGMSILLNQRAILGKNMYVVSHIGISIPLSGIPSEWLYYWLKIIDFKNLTHATTLPSLQLSKVQDIMTPLPPLPEQHRIVAKVEELFTRLDAGVEALKKVKVELKRYRQAVLKHAFEGRLTEEWREARKDEIEPASTLLERIKEERKKDTRGKKTRGVIARSESDEAIPKDEIAPPSARNDNLPPLPEGWVWTRVGEVSRKIHYGYTAKSSNEKLGPKLLRITDIQNNSVNWVSVPYCCISEEDKEKYLLNEGDLVFARTGATVGKSFLIFGKILEAVFASYLIRIILSTEVSNKFVYSYFQSAAYWQQISIGKLGIGQPNVNAEKLSGIVLPLPPLPEQHKVVEEIERHFSVADEVEKVVEQGLKQAERLRQSILKKAFEGKLVPQDSSDEPAEKLLERIKEEKARREAEGKAQKGIKRSRRL
ncbi:MAG: hypothetical protein A3C38_01915 [Planctomycetes bacterium RIFCSPHIGHO2_02_FULL_50_42]|nr:MAG: hypothetical protein A2060_05955 [Planctomycetes bacterium GWA2_50_13]OHB87585.1 MAG: hypothetical protein A3C38_01915 [Planctomycetes bacterium RIFCSPHIGHO2_02_FULL_50_42]OHB96027.1 MAG: hypothetical protein A3I59_10255 [Planctomycetes bacterium RIFCSPLOWO2_02_FULL_50_16]